MSDVHVVAQHLGKSFGDKRVLDDLSFSIAAGDVVGILGKNGAGKTTLLELMLGFTPATSGSVQVFGQDSFNLSGAAKARVGFVPQQDELINQLSVQDQVRVVGSFHRTWDEALITRLGDEWEVDMRARVKNMSVGQRQKLSILLSMGHRPDLLVLDEPVASLDPIARRQFLEQIVDVAADGRRSVVFSSHIVSDVERLANKIWIIKDGRFYWQGELDSLKESIVRVHLRSQSALPRDIALENALSIRRDDRCVSAVISHWREDALYEIERRTGIRPEVESLNLEEIFLELHR